MTIAERESTSISMGLSSLIDDSLPLSRHGALEKLVEMLEDAGENKRLLHRLSQKLAKSYKTCPDILTFYLGVDWRTRGDSFYYAYREVMLNLATVYPASISMIMQALLSRYLVRRESSRSDADFLSLAEMDEVEADDRTTQVILKLIKLVPSAGAFLVPSVEYNFPFHGRGLLEHVSYVCNLLHLAKSAPMWRMKILGIIISKALIIDVELQNDSDALKKVDLEKQILSCTTDEGDDAGDELVVVANKTDEVTKERRRLRRIRRGMLKLDCILSMVFSFISNYMRSTSKTGDLDERRSREMFNFILEVFERNILPTFKSRYLQFFLFYMASLRPELADQFLGLLFRPLVSLCQGLDHGRLASPTPNLLLAVSYIGSFVARAKFLTDDLLILAFETLVELSTRLLEKQGGPSVISPGILPIMSLQHIMYIFTTRHACLVSKMGQETIASLFDRLLADPALLEHCNYSVVKAFYIIATQHYDNLIPEDMLEVLDEERSRRECSQRSKFEDLESYFPFDPLPLPRSAIFIPSTIYNSFENATSASAAIAVDLLPANDANTL